MSGQQNVPIETVLAEWDEDAIAAVREIGQEDRVAKGRLLRGRDPFLLLDGMCALCMEAKSGREIAIIHFSPGRLLNFMPCIQDYYMNIGPTNIKFADNNFYIKILTDCLLLRIDHELFLEKYFFSLPMHSLIVKSLVQNFTSLYASVFNLREMPAWQRIAEQLLANMSANPPHESMCKITYAEIAAYLSLHPVTVAKIYSAMQDAGIIERQRDRILVLDPQRLQRLSQGTEPLFYKNKKAPQGHDAEDA